MDKVKIQNRLRNMERLSEDIKNNKIDVCSLATEDRYIRIGGEQYRAVCLNDKYPLCGFSKSKASNLETIFKHFDEKKNIRELEAGVWKNKEERRLQSWIIKTALLYNRDLKKALRLDIGYDKLLFALDEVSIGDNNNPISNKNALRCDILAVGVRGDSVFPVLIELKSNREMKRLTDQLEAFCLLIENKDFRINFKTILENCTGYQICDDFKTRKMMIWPVAKDRNAVVALEHVKKLNDASIDVIEYHLTNPINMNTVEFYPHLAHI